MTETLDPARWFAVVDGKRVRQLRRQHGLSPAELTGQADIGLSTVTRLERQHQRHCRTAPWPGSPPRWAASRHRREQCVRRGLEITVGL